MGRLRLRILLLFAAVFMTNIAVAQTPPAGTVFDAHPEHLWNRLHALFFVRKYGDTVYGDDALDPMLWPDTKYLFEGPSHAQAIVLLDEFLHSHGERLIAEPLKSAVMQRDMWAVFDWAAGHAAWTKEAGIAKLELTERLAVVIRRLALTEAQIRSLPDNYAAAVEQHALPTAFDLEDPQRAFLPPDLVTPGGPWVAVGTDRSQVPAPDHTGAFGDRSVFMSYMNLPDGRAQTLAYLATLNAFRDNYVFDDRGNPRVNPATPSFPVGTRVALVRRALLIDVTGKIVASPLTESVQLRVYRKLETEWPPHLDAQSMVEFSVVRAALLTGHAGGLRATGASDKGFPTQVFHSTGIDMFEFPTVKDEERLLLRDCHQCHAAPGILSFATRSFLPQAAPMPKLIEADFAQAVEWTAALKSQRYEWGLLQGLWMARNVRLIRGPQGAVCASNPCFQ